MINVDSKTRMGEKMIRKFHHTIKEGLPGSSFPIASDLKHNCIGGSVTGHFRCIRDKVEQIKI